VNPYCKDSARMKGNTYFGKPFLTVLHSAFICWRTDFVRQPFIGNKFTVVGFA